MVSLWLHVVDRVQVQGSYTTWPWPTIIILNLIWLVPPLLFTQSYSIQCTHSMCWSRAIPSVKWPSLWIANGHKDITNSTVVCFISSQGRTFDWGLGNQRPYATREGGYLRKGMFDTLYPLRCHYLGSPFIVVMVHWYIALCNNIHAEWWHIACRCVYLSSYWAA